MKKIIFLLATVLCIVSCTHDDPVNDPSSPTYNPANSTYKVTGYVVDNLNSRQSAVVSLTDKSAEKKEITTGSNGDFNFPNLTQGAYTIEVTKEGYEGTSKEITVNKDTDIGALRITIKSSEVVAGQDTLDFGASGNSLPLSFQVLSFLDDEWKITHNCSWILKIEPDNGKLVYNEKEKKPQTVTVSVQIDREKLVAGKNEDRIQITTSSNGGANIIVQAYNVSIPAVITNPAVLKTPNSATFSGTVTDAGNPDYTERGFVYDIIPVVVQPALPATVKKVTAEKNSDADYSWDVPELAFNTSYYVRAFITNSNGTAYGEEVNFTSGAELATLSTNAPADISTNSVLLGGNIITTGNPPYNERGVCYGVSTRPDIDNSIKAIITGDGTGSFSKQVSGLSSGTKYYVRAYAKSGDSGTAYGDEEVSFTTHAPVSVNTQAVSSTNITTSSAKIYGNITNEGVPAYSEKGICYGTSNNPRKETAFSLPVTGTGTGMYYADINLDANTKYYACAYATNELGTVYGKTVDFTTKLEKAKVSTQAPATLSGTSVRLNGTIISAGNPPYIERGFVCGMSSFPTVSDTKIPVSGEDADSFSATFNYKNNYIYSYHVRAYAINADKSVSYGEEDYLFFFEVSF
jgi:hypothetical protein